MKLLFEDIMNDFGCLGCSFSHIPVEGDSVSNEQFLGPSVIRTSTLQSMVGLYIWHLFCSVFNFISPSVHFYHFKVPHLKQYCSKPVMHMNYTCGGGCFVTGRVFIF